MGTVGHCPHRSLLPSLPESEQVRTWELLDTVLTEACCQVYRSQSRYVHGNCWTLSSSKLVARSTRVRAGRYMGTVGLYPHRSLLPSLPESGQVGTWELCDTVLTEACCQVYRSQGREVHGNCWTLSSPKLVAKSTGVRAGRYMGTVGHCPNRSLLSCLPESVQVSTCELFDTVLTEACCRIYRIQSR